MMRRALSFAVALAALSAHAEPISFDGTTAVGEITPGGTSAWMIAATFSDPSRSHGTLYRNAMLTDDDHDGIVRLEVTPPLGTFDERGGLWTMTDVAAGAIHAIRGNGEAAPADPFPSDVLGRDPSGVFGFVVIATRFREVVDVLWIRPGADAWRGRARDGGRMISTARRTTRSPSPSRR